MTYLYVFNRISSDDESPDVRVLAMSCLDWNKAVKLSGIKGDEVRLLAKSTEDKDDFPLAMRQDSLVVINTYPAHDDIYSVTAYELDINVPIRLSFEDEK